MDINFELYKIFYHAAVSESFSDAAQKLYISQSAVSQAIKKLEEKLGCRLFIRKSRQIKLTEEGKMLFLHVGQAYNFLKTAEKKFDELKNMDAGEVRVGASDTICKYFLIPCLKSFTDMYPSIKIEVINRTSMQIIEILQSGMVDLGIVTLPVEHKDLDVIEFMTVEDVFAASRKYSCLSGRKVSLSELAQYPVMMLQKNSKTRKNFDEFLKEKGIQMSPEIELESVDLLVEFAKIGLGICHVLKESVIKPVESGELFIIDTMEPLPERKLGIIKMKNVPLSRASENFLKSLAENRKVVS